MVAIIDDLIAVIVGLATGVISWLLALPDWAKYLVFVSGLLGSTIISSMTGVNLLSGIIETIIKTLSGATIKVYEIQLLVIAVILPFVFYMLTHFNDR